MVDAAALPPVAEDDFCGPDLDLGGDGEFMNFMAATEGLLPHSFFSFDRKSIDFAAVTAAGEALLARTHDIRLLALLAKLAALNRDFAGFAKRAATIAWLLANHWDDVHPRAEEGDYSNRLAQLGTLDDGPVAVLPLQYAPLIETRRDGAVVYRAQMVALGDAKPREGEALTAPAAMDRIFGAVEIDVLREASARAENLKAALAQIRAVTLERLGFERSIEFKALAPLVDKICDFLRAALVRRDPTLAPPPEAAAEAADAAPDAAAPGQPQAPLDTLEDVDAALGAALAYFAAREPSSPALLLISQAREALGKNLFEVMQLLAPTHAANARVFVGPEGAFTVPVSSLSSAPALEFRRAAPEPAASRAAALSLVDAVTQHFRRVEPSSPIPHLLERARLLAARDFVSLLQDLLPEDDLSAMKAGR